MSLFPDGLSEAIATRLRALKARLGTPRAKVVYRADYAFAFNELNDPERGSRILDHLLAGGHIVASQALRPPDIAMAALTAVHDPEYLLSLDGDPTLDRVFGDLSDERDSASLVRQQRAMTAGTVLAVEQAVAAGRDGPLQVNLGGGFHHAFADHGEGLCLINDIAVAIHRVRTRGFRGRILVVDLDLHQGNGTRTIFAEDSSVHTLSIHAEHWNEDPCVADTNIALGAGVGDDTYREALLETLPEVFNEVDPELIIYVAGVDIARDDMLGSWRVSAETVLWRDQQVLGLAAGRPIAWLLAGGYGPNAWRYTARSLAWWISDLDSAIPTDQQRALENFRRIKKRFKSDELRREPDELTLTDDDLYADLGGGPRASRVLGYYSAWGVELAFERYGILEHLRRRGYPRVRFELELDHPRGEMIRIRADDGDREPLLELIVLKSARLAPWSLLYVEWLLLQDPRRPLSGEREPLPGQEHPGLGAFHLVVGMLIMACERLQLDGLGFSPAHYHMAVMSHGQLSFHDPADEARLCALEAALEGIPIGRASRMVDRGEVIDGDTGETVRWRSGLMIYPTNEELAKEMSSPEHQRAVESGIASHNYRLRGGEGSHRHRRVPAPDDEAEPGP